MKLISLAVLFTGVSLLGGCASMSEDECRNADWYMIGLEDGSRGAAVTTLANHRKACAKANVTPDLNAYESGHRTGLTRYCTYTNGVSLGRSGAGVNGSCPASAVAFFDGYDHGHQIYEASRKVASIKAKITETEGLLETLSTDIETAEQTLVEGTGDKNTRRDMLNSLRDMREEVSVHTEELSHLQYSLKRAERHYQALLND